jgi:hypothetical protein
MSDRVRRFGKKFFTVCFIKKVPTYSVKNLLNSGKEQLSPIKKNPPNILICIRLRFKHIISKIYRVPMQNLSTSPKRTDLNSEKKRLENRLQLEPKTATLEKILQFASTYRAERICENQYVEWYLN